MSIIGIIQARMGSTRLPGKIMAEIAGAPLLRHVVTRAARAERIERVVVATTTASSDDPVENMCHAEGIAFFRGSEADVLDRYYQAAREFGATAVVRLTADCPLLDPEVVDQVIAAYQDNECDYAANILDCTYPDGLDAEVFGFDVLERAWREARLASEREHVTPYIRNHPELFRHISVRGTDDWSSLRWTVDEPRDLQFVREVYSLLNGSVLGWSEVLSLLQTRPELMAINSGIERNAGYHRSLAADGLVDFLKER